MKTIAQKEISQALADLGVFFDYPDSALAMRVRGWITRYSRDFVAAKGQLDCFLNEIEKRTTNELEEIFTRTFDMAPLCNPYLTSYLYGAENYERGNLMTKLSERYREDGFDTAGELPDHLGLLLKFAPNFSGEELSELVEYCLLKPVEEMRASIESDENPYRHLLGCVLEMLRII
ncbi:MAG: nitrate reductase molybdenum cofactor assembly chaperone [Candidatus Obscuribacterales bacterium]|nr:nitrate reductase molybdenum cofactor assembly chaperone [Candidatus Obscuribacterales bacterium]